jgi:endoglucanase
MMGMNFELLKKLSDAHGISGFEGNIRDIVKEEIKGFVDEIREDSNGNLIAIRHGSGLKVMIASHMDEIGFMVQYVTTDGFIKFVPIGGWYAPSVHTRRVMIHGTKGPVYGVIGSKPPHVMQPEDRKKPVELKHMFIDIGCSRDEEVQDLGIEVGAPITVDTELVRLAGSRVTGKALDNRAGVYVLIEALKQMETSYTIYGVFTAQEEVGLKGARGAAFSIDPDIAIATDVTIPGDHPGITKEEAPVLMGSGPVIGIVNSAGRGLISDPNLIAWLRKAGDAEKISYQLEVSDGGNTDASAINLVRAGIPSVPLSVPTRYIHSPVEVLDMKDIESTIHLIIAALKTCFPV